MPFSSVCYFLELLVPLMSHVHHQIEPVIRSLVFLVQTLHKPISSVSDMLPILKQLNACATKTTSEFRVCIFLINVTLIYYDLLKLLRVSLLILF